MRMLEVFRSNYGRNVIQGSESFIMAGTLIILITSLFMNAGAIRIVKGSREMEQIVMNSVIAASTGGLYVVGVEKMTNEWLELTQTQ